MARAEARPSEVYPYQDQANQHHILNPLAGGKDNRRDVKFSTQRTAVKCSVETALLLRAVPVTSADPYRNGIVIFADDGTVWVWTLITSKRART